MTGLSNSDRVDVVRGPLHVRWMGRVPYREGTALQHAMFTHGQHDHLLLLEHDHVFTHGPHANLDEHVLIDPESSGIELIEVDRGGDVTYHGPGQVVGYPIIDLDYYFTDIHKYLRYLEEVIISTLSDYGLKTGRSDGETGVWMDEGTPFARKLCAMGVKASRWTTMHGFALNVNVDLSHFDYIVPCGISDKKVTSLNVELGRDVDLNEVKDKIKFYFQKQFNCAFIPAKHLFK